ncbi:hypothetical protein TanjilG_00306 [Lupinus angustifolius]|uniref:DUF7138 domain-containing protein n=1 Tax=Lupinus angustifolius TaxID=3871 RepID=A0A4P1QQI1_LUPAN|nr:PREDICTED: uncharacterized protein LOC109333796 [Lupinus angustifolius]OIV92288.1 hypothetical protein TanjilG_00306 [Lupinus angustifolius]
MIGGGGPSFSVVYFDGEKETSIGDVTVDPSFNFNKFLSFLTHKIGISPHQFSIYLASFGSNRKIPITARVNFSAIVRDTAGVTASSFFFIKRSKRPKKNKVHSNKVSWINDNKNNIIMNNHPTTNIVLHRRNAAVPFTMSPVLSRFEFEKHMMDLQMQRELYLMSTGGGSVCGGDVICEECLTEMNGGFHPCVFDDVTFGFRSPAGPVARPIK